MAPLDEFDAADGYSSLEALGEARDRIEIETLPSAYRPDKFLKALPSVSRLMKAKIKDSRWLCFAIGGLFGDWGSVAAIHARGMGKSYAVWTDKVESEVARKMSETSKGKSALRARLTHRPMALLERYVISGSSLGLFHGRETYDAYHRFSKEPHLVHNIHLKEEDQISHEELHVKVAQAQKGPLRILYAGRVAPEKGPMDWLQTLRQLKNLEVPFEAIWIGGGSLLSEFRSNISRYGLEGCVSAPGRIDDRNEVLQHYRWANVFMFCHLTAESPRCLIEALKSGAPIVGYESAYPRDLISHNKGGRLTDRGDVDQLAKAVVDLNRDRTSLSELILAAAADGLPFSDANVFRHRADLIKAFT